VRGSCISATTRIILLQQCVHIAYLTANMGFFKGLFVGVYASNGAIRAAFLPLLYLLLSTPFILVFARYYRIDSRISAVLFKDRSLTDTLLQGFVVLVAFLLPTRIISAGGLSAGKDGGKRRVQQVPYWIPGVRHWGNVVFGGERWLRGVRYVKEVLDGERNANQISESHPSRHLLRIMRPERSTILSFLRSSWTNLSKNRRA